MFKCQKCGKNSLSYEKQNKVITEKRDRTYYNVIVLDLITKEKKFLQYANKDYKILAELKEKGYKVIKDYLSKGNEIRKEISVCTKCK